MRVVGQGHQFHPETGLCRRCEVDINADVAKYPCAKAKLQAVPKVRRPPNPHADSKPKAE